MGHFSIVRLSASDLSCSHPSSGPSRMYLEAKNMGWRQKKREGQESSRRLGLAEYRGKGGIEESFLAGSHPVRPPGREDTHRALLSLAHAPSGADRWPRGPVTVNPDPSHLPSQAPP